jgi:pilus assembly protein Flp/PilA
LAASLIGCCPNFEPLISRIATATICRIATATLAAGIYRPFRRPAYISGMAKQIRSFLKDESAATAIEYGLIAAGIAVAIIPVITGVGTHLKSTFQAISTAVK